MYTYVYSIYMTYMYNKYCRCFLFFHIFVIHLSFSSQLFSKNIQSLTLLYFEVKWSERCSVVSNSLQPHGLYSPCNSPGQNNGVCSLSLLQGDLPILGIEPRSPVLQVDFFTSWATREVLLYFSFLNCLCNIEF